MLLKTTLGEPPLYIPRLLSVMIEFVGSILMLVRQGLTEVCIYILIIFYHYFTGILSTINNLKLSIYNDWKAARQRKGGICSDDDNIPEQENV